MYRFRLRRDCAGPFAVFAVATCIVLGAWGEDISFTVRIQNMPREASVPVVDKAGAPYVSLSSLLSQMGGVCSVESGRIQADLSSQSAWLAPDSSEVQSSLDNFLLKSPVIQEGSDVLVSVEEVESFFIRAFGVSLGRTAAAATASQPGPESASTTEPPVALDALTPLEPVAPEPEAEAEAPRAANRGIQVVVVDPGHGGKDAGCTATTGTREADVVLAIAGRLRPLLEQGSPLKCALTRDKDHSMTRAERVASANSNKGDLLISIHAGGSPAPESHGVQIFCCSAESQAPASGEKGEGGIGTEYVDRSVAVAGAVGEALKQSTGAEDRGVWRARCHVLKDVAMPGILVEVGFITNPNEEGLLVTEAYQQKIAEGIAAGVKAYIAGTASKGASQ